MKNNTWYYIQLHLEYLQEIESGNREDDLPSFSSIYDHMHAFFITIGLKDADACIIINELRGKK